MTEILHRPLIVFLVVAFVLVGLRNSSALLPALKALYCYSVAVQTTQNSLRKYLLSQWQTLLHLLKFFHRSLEIHQLHYRSYLSYFTNLPLFFGLLLHRYLIRRFHCRSSFLKRSVLRGALALKDLILKVSSFCNTRQT